MARPPQARANRVVVAEQQAQCYRLRLVGHSIRDIAAETGLSTGTVSNRIRSEINARVVPLADELRAMELDRLDRWLIKLNEQIEAGRAVARHVEVGIRVSERRARLMGLDAPIKARVETITLDMIDAEIARLDAELTAQGCTTEEVITARIQQLEAELAGYATAGGGDA